MQFALGCCLSLLLFLTLMAALAWSRRVWGVSLETCRRTAHVGMGLASLCFPLFIAESWQALSFAFLFLLVLGCLRLNPQWLGGGGGILPRSRCRSEGEFYFVGGIALALLAGREDRCLYSASVLLLTFADSAAATVGLSMGKRRCWGNAKTLEGSLAFGVIGSLALLGPMLFFGRSSTLVLVGTVCLLATVTEAVCERGSDNLWIPAVCIVGLRLPSWMSEPIPLAAGYCVWGIFLFWVVFRKTRASAATSEGSAARTRMPLRRKDCIQMPL